MSMLRKTFITTAIIGAGLASTSGAAFAGDHHGHGHQKSGHGHEASHENGSGTTCLNAVDADAPTGAGSVLGGLFGAEQSVGASNLCDNLNGNKILSDNNIALGDIRNGDSTTNTETTRSASTEGNDSPATISPIPTS